MLEIICQAAPGRRNEDAYVAYQRDDGQPRYVLAAIDGATTVASFKTLNDYLETFRNGITPAALAATVTRDAILQTLGNLSSNNDIDPRHLILQANASLRELLDSVAPEIFDAKAMIEADPALQPLLEDPRKIRLFLPSAVLSLATIDTELKLLQYAHAGDTALLVAYHDGRVEVPTHIPRRINYDSALAVASNTVRKDRRMNDAVDDPLVRALDRDHRIYHNYVDEDGNTIPDQGVGVVDGLPELADYIKTGLVPLHGVQALMLISDGFWWPAPLHESDTARDKRIQAMWQRIQRDGLYRYFLALRQEEKADAEREKYPRFKLHDDATALLLWLNDE